MTRFSINCFDRKALISGGKWRRRESNPRPQPHRLSVYKRRLPFRFARRPGCSRPTDALADPLDVALWAISSPSAPSPFVGAASEPRAHPGRRRRLGSPRRRVRDRSSHLRFAGGFTRPTGDLGLQLIRMDRPRRNQVAPVCSCPNCSRARVPRPVRAAPAGLTPPVDRRPLLDHAH